MKNINDEVERLFKIFNFDNALYVITSVTIMKRLIENYLSLNNKTFSFVELIKLLNVNFEFSLEKKYYVETTTLLEQLNKYNIASNEILNGQINSTYKVDFLVYSFYELCFLLKREDYCMVIKEVFSEFDSSFLEISNKYKEGRIFVNDNIDNIVNMDFKKIDTTLRVCRNSIKKFKNCSLKFEETHNQYQKRYWALSDKQESIISKIYTNLDGVHLVEGVAGSGKSLVLLKLFEKINDELDNQAIFLTYNKSLVRFDKSGLKLLNSNDDCINKIRTFDSYCIYLLERIANKKIFLRENSSKFEEYFGLIIKEALNLLNGENLSCKINSNIILTEIENSINLNYLTKEEYINSNKCTKFTFSGLSYELNKEEKKLIWRVSTIFKDLLETRKYLPRNYAMIYLLKAIEGQRNIGLKNYIIVDEVQDLSLAEILLLNKLSRRSLILAGDINQSIYQDRVAWEEDRLPFAIKRYQLKFNYRNSSEIRIFSEAYLNSFNPSICRGPVLYDSSCTGLKPRLFMRSHVEDTLDLMIDKIKMDITEFDLDLSDILIVCVSQYILEEVEKRINLPICRLKSTNFEESRINISSMYSSKGTGFPYMYFFLSNKIYIPFFFKEGTRCNLMKKLIYVSITRSMNSLNIFIPSSREPLGPIKNLIQLFKK
ncbi:MAG: AAA family ATPase [Spirochaetaceae bacterium]|nr:AAA family ATPase [Spirochaetaceae bacterium]